MHVLLNLILPPCKWPSPHVLLNLILPPCKGPSSHVLLNLILPLCKGPSSHVLLNLILILPPCKGSSSSVRTLTPATSIFQTLPFVSPDNTILLPLPVSVRLIHTILYNFLSLHTHSCIFHYSYLSNYPHYLGLLRPCVYALPYTLGNIRSAHPSVALPCTSQPLHTTPLFPSSPILYCHFQSCIPSPHNLLYGLPCIYIYSICSLLRLVFPSNIQGHGHGRKASTHCLLACSIPLSCCYNLPFDISHLVRNLCIQTCDQTAESFVSPFCHI